MKEKYVNKLIIMDKVNPENKYIFIMNEVMDLSEIIEGEEYENVKCKDRYWTVLDENDKEIDIDKFNHIIVYSDGFKLNDKEFPKEEYTFGKILEIILENQIKYYPEKGLFYVFCEGFKKGINENMLDFEFKNGNLNVSWCS